MKKYTEYFKSITTFFTAFFGRKLKIISTFNGIGAATEALKQLGVDYDMHTVCEIEKNANNTYYKNNDKTNHVDDINELEKNIEKNLKLDILVQTPPCQSFSLAGKRTGLESNNGNLFLTAIKLQVKVDANVVIYENVSGLVSHHKTHYIYKNTNGEKVEFTSKPKEEKIKKNGLTLVKTIDLRKPSLINKDYDGKKKSIGNTLHTIEKLLLEDTRYNYHWKIINSCDQGLPQNRQRIFIVGIKKELDKGFTFPENKDLAFEVSDILESKPANNVFYKNEARHKLNQANQKRRKNRIHTYGKYVETMSYEATRRVSYPYVSPCITTGNNCKFMIDNKVRVLTSTELKRVHGFGDSFKFVGSTTQQYKQLGNTVSPGVYVNIFTSIFNSVEFEKSVNNEDYKKVDNKTLESTTSTKKIKRRKNRPKNNNHINISKKVSNISDSNYIYLTQEMFNDYSSHLNNGGTITVTLEVYKKDKNKNGKKSKELDCKKIITVDSLKLLGLTNKSYGYHRVRVDGISEVIEDTQANHVLISRMGGKTKFRNKIDYALESAGLKNKKVPVVLDAFFGGGGLTFHAIDKLKFDRYIINDLEPLIYKTYLAVKKDYRKVIEYYEKNNNKYMSLFSDELKNAKKDPNVRIDPKLQEIRNKDRRYRDYYQLIGNKLNNHKDMDLYEVAGCFIFFNARSNCGVLSFQSDGSIDVTNCDNRHTKKDKTPMIKQWAYTLNKHNIEILNKDVFEVLKNIPKDSFVISDSPYIAVEEEQDDKIMNYDFDNSVKFQLNLKKELDTFENVIYCNEHCKRLHDLGLTDNFEGYSVFPRNNKLGQKKEKTRESVEFLGYRGNYIPQQNTILENVVSTTSINNTNYKSEIKETLVS